MKRRIKALLPSDIVCLQKCNRSSQIKVRFHPCTGAATMPHSVEFDRKKSGASTNCCCSSRGFLPASLSYTGTYFERSLRDGCVGIPYCQLCADPPAPVARMCTRINAQALPHPYRSLSLSLSPYCVNMNAFQPRRKGCVRAVLGYIVGVFQGVLTVAAALETWFSRVLCCFLCTMVRAYIRSHAVCI